MAFVLRVLAIAALGAVLGLGSAHLALDGGWFESRRIVGPWIGAPGSGALRSDPYSAATLARSGIVPLQPGEGVTFTATRDSFGLPLLANCHYTLQGALPARTLWTLAVTDVSGRPAPGAARVGLTSRDALRIGESGIQVTFGPTVRPWEYLSTAGLSSLALSLRIYGAPSGSDAPVGGLALPVITREACL